MSVALFIGLFFGYCLAVRPVLSLPMPSGLLLAAQIVLGIGALVFPLLAFSAIDHAWWKKHVQRVAKDWCSSIGIDFKRAELHKNHFTAVGSVAKKNVRRRFRMSRHSLVWKINKIEWLDPDVSPKAATVLPDKSLEQTREE
jgi:hypothetical protein